MHIIADSNTLFGDPLMSTPPWKSLWEYLERTGDKLLLSEIVKCEVLANVKRRCNKLRQAIGSDIAELGKLNGSAASATLPPESDDCQAVESRIAQLVKEQKIEILPIIEDGTVVRKLVTRATGRTPPFDENGNGFRDTLIWLSLCQRLKISNSAVAFISNDKAFWNQKDKEARTLKPELQTELGKTELLPFHKLTDFLGAKANSINFVTEQWAEAALQADLARIQKKLVAYQFDRDGWDAFSNACEDEDWELVGNYKVIEISDINLLNTFVVEGDSNSHRLYVEVEGTASAEVEVEKRSRAHEFGGGGDNQTTEVVSASFTAELEFEFSSEKDVSFSDVSTATMYGW